jgi:type VI secretion system protein ImpH
VTPRDQLARDSTRFAFDAAVRILLHQAGTADPGHAARFETPPNLAYPGAEISSVNAGAKYPSVVTTVIGMTGPSGVLPRGYSEAVAVATRDRSPSLQAFLDMLANRFIAGFAQAGAKYRPHRAVEDAALAGSPDPVGRVLLALTGYGIADLGARLAPGDAALKHYAGFFSARPRSADRLASLASDWLQRPVRIVQFAGVWLPLPPSERSALPSGKGEGAVARLGVDAAAGVRAWDSQARVVLRVGPLDRAAFESLLPGKPSLARFVGLIRAYLGFETAFAVNLVLRRDAVPALSLDASTHPRLGWNTWLTAAPSSRLTDPDEPIFEAETVEHEAAGASGGA